METAYPEVLMRIGAGWTRGAGAEAPILNPATEETIGRVPHASTADLDDALAAADAGFKVWRRVSAFDRYKLMRKAAELLRQRAGDIATIMTLEQGKPVAEAKGETLAGADVIDWFAEEGRRANGWIVPPRVDGVEQLVVKEPIGPVAAFSPWNFPINQAVRKISGALAAGCSIIIKGPEETPASCMELVRAFIDAGLPDGVLNLVFGVPAEISAYLIPHPIIRKVTFTGSTAVGKQLAAMAGLHMKPATMELGGHAPAIVFDDADVDKAVGMLSANKFRNAGQVCVAPTRFMLQNGIYDRFVEAFTAVAASRKLGDGLEAGTNMGPLAHDRRLPAVQGLVDDAVAHGGRVLTGGKRLGNRGYFFEPTVLVDTPRDARIMNEEPFGPVAIMTPFDSFDEAVEESNRLPYGLAAYAYSSDRGKLRRLSAAVEAGMVSANHHGLALPEVPFGGIKDSGYGSEGGLQALDAYLITKFVTIA